MKFFGFYLPDSGSELVCGKWMLFMALCLQNISNKSYIIIPQWHVLFVIRVLEVTWIWCNSKEDTLPKSHHLWPQQVFPGWRCMNSAKHLTGVTNVINYLNYKMFNIQNLKFFKWLPFLGFLQCQILSAELNSKSLSDWKFQ